MGFAYLKDKNAVYYFLNSKLTLIKEADSSTFKVQAQNSYPYYNYYLYDKNHVWTWSDGNPQIKLINGANPKTFNFSKDADSFFQ